MFEWIAREEFRGEVPALRKEHPGLLSLSDWAVSKAAGN